MRCWPRRKGAGGRAARDIHAAIPEVRWPTRGPARRPRLGPTRPTPLTPFRLGLRMRVIYSVCVSYHSYDTVIKVLRAQ